MKIYHRQNEISTPAKWKRIIKQSLKKTPGYCLSFVIESKFRLATIYSNYRIAPYTGVGWFPDEMSENRILIDSTTFETLPQKGYACSGHDPWIPLNVLTWRPQHRKSFNVSYCLTAMTFAAWHYVSLRFCAWSGSCHCPKSKAPRQSLQIAPSDQHRSVVAEHPKHFLGVIPHL